MDTVKKKKKKEKRKKEKKWKRADFKSERTNGGTFVQKERELASVLFSKCYMNLTR